MCFEEDGGRFARDGSGVESLLEWCRCIAREGEESLKRLRSVQKYGTMFSNLRFPFFFLEWTVCKSTAFSHVLKKGCGERSCGCKQDKFRCGGSLDGFRGGESEMATVR